MAAHDQPVELPIRIVCEKCGRLFYEGFDDLEDWLIAPWKINPERWTIRCAPHISIWSLRRAGYGRSRHIMRQVTQMQERDSKRFVSENPYAMPFPRNF